MHADLLELPIESYHKKRWCLLVLDYLSYSYMALLRSKSKTFENIKQIIQTMENQFNSSIKCFRSDQGGEFKSSEFKKYLKDKGIIHEYSAPHIHQKKDVLKDLTT